MNPIRYESVLRLCLLGFITKCGHVSSLFWLSKLILLTLSQPRTCAKRNKAQITGEVVCSMNYLVQRSIRE